MTASETGRDEARARELMGGAEHDAPGRRIGWEAIVDASRAGFIAKLVTAFAEVRREERERCVMVVRDAALVVPELNTIEGADYGEGYAVACKQILDTIRAIPATPDAGGNR